MAAARATTYRIGDLDIDVSRGAVRRGSEELYLRPQAMEVLVHLIERRGSLVSKDELLRTVWSDAAVGENTLVQCVADIRRALGDDARRPHVVKTIHKYGYELVAEVFEVPPRGTDHAALSVASPGRPSRRPSRRPLTLGALALLLSASVAAWWWSGPPAPRVTRLALARFENRTGRPELDWLREGLPEMLVTGVAGAGPFEVVSQPEAGSVQEMLAAARRSEADVLLLGSFATMGRQFRVDVHAHEVATGRLIAAEKLVADEGGQILAHVDLLSTKLASHLRPPTTEPLPSTGFTETGR